MKGTRVAVLWWSVEGGRSVESLRRVVGGHGEVVVAEGRPLSESVVEALARGAELLVVHGSAGMVAALGEHLGGSPAGVLPLPSQATRALCADLGIEGDLDATLERLLRLVVKGAGWGRRGVRATPRRALRVSASFEAAPRYGFTFAPGRMGDLFEASGRGRRAVLSLLGDWARELAGELLPGAKGTASAAPGGRLALDGAPFAEALHMTVVSTLAGLPAGLKDFERAIETEPRFHVLHAEPGALLSQSALAILPARRPGGDALRVVQGSHLVGDLDADFVLDGVRVRAEGPWALGVSVGPIVPLRAC